MLSGSVDIMIDGSMGVQLAAVPLPNGSQGFVGFTTPAMFGMAYLDPNDSNQVRLIRRSGEVCPDLWKWPRTQ